VAALSFVVRHTAETSCPYHACMPSSHLTYISRVVIWWRRRACLHYVSQPTYQLSSDLPNLTSLAGLSSLQSVALGFFITNCPKVLSLAPLAGLQSVAGFEVNTNFTALCCDELDQLEALSASAGRDYVFDGSCILCVSCGNGVRSLGEDCDGSAACDSACLCADNATHPDTVTDNDCMAVCDSANECGVDRCVIWRVSHS
jgi:hypothetical protein